MHMAVVVPTWHRSGQQLLQVVPEQQLVAGDLEAGTEEESSMNALEHLIRQSVLAGSRPLGSYQLCTSNYHGIRNSRHMLCSACRARPTVSQG